MKNEIIQSLKTIWLRFVLTLLILITSPLIIIYPLLENIMKIIDKLDDYIAELYEKIQPDYTLTIEVYE